MALSGSELQELIYGAGPGRRFTQDSPVMPDVWLAYGQSPEPVDLLLTPHTGTTPGALAAELQARLSKGARVAHSDTYVVARLSFDDLISQALPLTHWWHDQIVDADEKRPDETFLPDWLKDAERSKLAPQVQWLIEVVVRLLAQRVTGDGPKKIEQAAIALLGKSVRSSRRKTQDDPSVPMLWLVSRNRPAQFAIWGSRPAVKADAAVELFSIELQLDRLGGDRLRCRRKASGAVRPRRRRAAQACIRARRGDEDRSQQLARGRDLRLHDAAGTAGRRRAARPGADGRGAGSAPGPAAGAEERALDRLGGAGADPARAARPGVVQTAGPRPRDARGRDHDRRLAHVRRGHARARDT